MLLSSIISDTDNRLVYRLFRSFIFYGVKSRLRFGNRLILRDLRTLCFGRES
jgi:hypothetical protein